MLLAYWLMGTSSLFAQSNEPNVAGGALLGAYSGATTALIGGALPCNRVILGSTCATIAGGLSGLAGLSFGAVIGDRNPMQISERFDGALIGVLVGAGVGVGLRRGVRQYGWRDVAVVAFAGGAIGAAPVGAAIGASVGAAVGGFVWAAFPRAGLQDFSLFTLAGVAVGSLVDWAYGAAHSEDATTTRPTLSLSVPLGW